jgi:V/A-type H+-transporting ATPase subunit F
VKGIVVITPPDATHGFALAGVRQLNATADTTPAALHELSRDPATGVVIIDERLVSRPLREQIRVLEERWPGLVVVLPAPLRAKVAEEDYVLQLIRRAIGYQVRLS